MSRILVVEPHKILQRAIAVSFFPEHQVEFTDTVPEMTVLEDYYAIVVDAGSLREKYGAGDELKALVQSWRIPTIWVDDSRSSVAPVREKLVALAKPISKNDLISALAKSQQASSKVGEQSAEQSARKSAKRVARKTKPVLQSEQKYSRIIDLVDVVEEGHLAGKPKNRPAKKKK